MVFIRKSAEYNKHCYVYCERFLFRFCHIDSFNLLCTVLSYVLAAELYYCSENILWDECPVCDPLYMFRKQNATKQYSNENLTTKSLN